MTVIPVIHGFVELKKLFADGLEPIIVSLDFENLDVVSGDSNGPNSQAGFAILDTKNCVQAATRGDTVKSFRSSSYIAGTPNYFLENVPRHMFGAVEHINKYEMARKIDNFIQTNSKPGRPLVLIGHGVKGDIKCLQSLGLDLSRFTFVFDTYLISKFDLKQKRSLKLMDLVQICGINAHMGLFHNGSNDAAFTLRAFIKLITENVPTFGNPSMRQGLTDFFNFGFDSPNNPVRLMADTTTDESRRIPAKTMIINNVGKWTGAYADHLNSFVDAQDRPGSPKRLAQAKIFRQIRPSSSEIACAQPPPPAEPFKFTPSAPEFTSMAHLQPVALTFLAAPLASVPAYHNGAVYYNNVSRPTFPPGLHPQFYMRQSSPQ